MKRARLAVIVATLSLVLAGCTPAPTKSSGDAGDLSVDGGSKGKTVAYFAPSLGISYWQWVGSGVESQAKKLGMEYTSYNADNDQSKQLDNMRTAITAGVDAIVIGPVSSTSVPPLLKLAKNEGIPVAFTGIGPAEGETDYVSAVTADNEQTGIDQGAFVCEQANELGGNKVAMLSLPQDRENAQRYLQGAKQSFKDKGCELVQVIQTKNLTVAEAVEQTNDLLTSNPDITGIYGMYDEAGTGAAQVLGERGLTGKIALATADGSPTTVKLLREGHIDALFLQQAVGQGIEAANQVANALDGKETTKALPLEMTMVTSENIDEEASQKALRRVYPDNAGAH